jgi:hypothetical protein
MQHHIFLLHYITIIALLYAFNYAGSICEMHLTVSEVISTILTGSERG